jgi:hypothetical protein
VFLFCVSISIPGIRTQLRDLAARYARGSLSKLLSPPNRGRGECRAPDAPDSGVCNNSGRTHTRFQVTPEITRHSPRNGLQLTPRSPRRPAFLPPSLADLPSANLMPAPGHQDHTASPSASGALVRRTVRVHRIPLHVRDDRERPSERSGTGRACRDDLPDETSGIFLSKGLDDPNHVDPARQIGFCAQAAGALGATVHPPGGHGFALDA